MNLNLLLAANLVSEKPFYEQQSIWIMAAMTLAIIVAIFAGNALARMFRSTDHGWKISTILAACLCAAVVVSFGSSVFKAPFYSMAKSRLEKASVKTEANLDIDMIDALAAKEAEPPIKWRLGVDLRGGYTFIGELNEQELGTDGGERITVQDIIPRLMERVDPSGTLEISIRAMGPERLEVVIPDADKEEAERIWIRLTQTGQLLFRILADKTIDSTRIQVAETMMRNGNFAEVVTNDRGEVFAKWFKIARVRSPEGKAGANAPLKYVPVAGNYVRASDGTIVDIDSLYSQLGLGDAFFNEFGQEGAGEVLGKWMEKFGFEYLEILVVEPPNEDDVYDVRGDHLSQVRRDYGKRGGLAIGFDMNKEGASRMVRLTAKNKDRSLGIVLESQLHSAPNINEPISSSGIIEGQFTEEEVQDLITTLNSGKIDVAFNKNPISKDYQFSSVGEELKNKGFIAIGISFVLVIIFMLFYYRFAGIIACTALFLNLLFLSAFIMLIKQPLTLTGLAGIVLTVGMSVDANVLIYERIREELARGASLRMAIRNGFDRATVTIVDANLTTLITALVLYVIGSEQIKGFAITLILGILMSMFTAIFCSRAVFELFERRGYLTKLTMMKMLNRTDWDFLGKRRLAAVVSIVCILAGLACVAYRGATIFDHDLRGGSTARIVFTENAGLTIEDVRKQLDKIDYEFNGEKIVFDAAALQNDEEFPNNLYVKIDSNLPLQEEEGVEKIKTIDEILDEAFGENLIRMQLDYEGLKVENSGGAVSVGQVNLKNRLQISALKSGLLNTSLLNTTLVSSISYQPQEESKSKQNDIQKQNEKQNSTGEQDKSDPETEQKSKSGSTGQDNLDTGENETTTPPTNVRDDQFKATAILKYRFSTSRSEVIAALIDQSEELSILLNQRNIEVRGGPGDDGTDRFRSKDWEIVMDRMTDETSAATLLDTYQGKLNAKPYFPTIGGVGGQIASRTQWQAFAAIIASLIGIIAYVWIRFQNIAFGLAAVVALIHDVLIVLGAIAVSYFLADYLGFMKIDNFKISLPIIAAFLTIIGYSLNDTIVVFDRIREVRGKRTEVTADMINQSISQTLSRTILTSITTFIVVFILFVLGGDAIHGFAFALVIGVIVGTYSSIFVASPVLLWLMNRSSKSSSTDVAEATS